MTAAALRWHLCRKLCLGAYPNVPRRPRGIDTVAMVDLAIVDLTAFRLEFIHRDTDEPIPPPGQSTNLQLLQARMHYILYL